MGVSWGLLDKSTKKDEERVPSEVLLARFFVRLIESSIARGKWIEFCAEDPTAPYRLAERHIMVLSVHVIPDPTPPFRVTQMESLDFANSWCECSMWILSNDEEALYDAEELTGVAPLVVRRVKRTPTASPSRSEINGALLPQAITSSYRCMRAGRITLLCIDEHAWDDFEAQVLQRRLGLFGLQPVDESRLWFLSAIRSFNLHFSLGWLQQRWRSLSDSQYHPQYASKTCCSHATVCEFLQILPVNLPINSLGCMGSQCLP